MKNVKKKLRAAKKWWKTNFLIKKIIIERGEINFFIIPGKKALAEEKVKNKKKKKKLENINELYSSDVHKIFKKPSSYSWLGFLCSEYCARTP